MPPSAGTSPPSVADFLRIVGRSRLLSAEVLSGLNSSGLTSLELAERLVHAGELTRFQAEKLLRGYWQGLMVGPYRLLCPLGRGGMGIVYLARGEKPVASGHRLVALKILPPQRARSEPRTLIRFQREMELGLALPSHPHLTRTTDAGESKGVHYLAMEYVLGKTVRQSVTDDGPMMLGAACRAFADAAAGLHLAHTAGFVHRDLKPSNVMLTQTGRGKVLDFGFALRIGETAPADPTILGGQGYTVGTMDYLPPEQATDAAAVRVSADIYALGCSLFFALTGVPPFPGGGPQEKIRWHRTSSPSPITEFDPTVPAELDRFVRWMMAKSANDRPTAERVAKELIGWADPVRFVPPGTEFLEPNLIREAESRWQATRNTVGPDAVDDDSPIILDSSSGEIAIPPTAGSPIAEPALARPIPVSPEVRPLVRVPTRRWVLIGLALLGLFGFFLMGLLVGVWATRR